MAQHAFSRIRSYTPLLWVLAAFALTLVFVNPLREMPMYDDWAYSWSVDRMLETGRYVQHPWIVPNNIAQIYWGALFELLFGNSFVALRASTLVLTVLMLAAFYLLAREFQISHAVSGLLTLMLFASPIGLTYGFSFMTDVPFVALTVVALWLYTRAIRTGSIGWMIAGGIVGGMATLTRQIGVAFAPALLLIWLFRERSIRKLPATLIGGALPVLGTIWQVYIGAAEPSWTASGSTTSEVAYLSNIGALIPETLWRLMAIMQMMAFLLLPLAIFAIVHYVQVLQKYRHISMNAKPARTEVAIMLGVGGFLLVMIGVGAFLIDMPGLMPYLAPTFRYLGVLTTPGLALLTALTSVGSFCIGRLLVLRYANGDWRDIPAHELILDLTTVIMLAINIFWFFYMDRYLLPLQPFAILIVGRAVAPLLEKYARAFVAITLVSLVFYANIVRADMAEQEAQAISANALLSQGIEPEDISSSWTWDSMHGAFDDFRVQEGVATSDMMDRFFMSYLIERQETARYMVITLSEAPAASYWQVVNRVSFIDKLGQTAVVYTLKRLDLSSE